MVSKRYESTEVGRRTWLYVPSGTPWSTSSDTHQGCPKSKVTLLKFNKYAKSCHIFIQIISFQRAKMKVLLLVKNAPKQIPLRLYDVIKNKHYFKMLRLMSDQRIFIVNNFMQQNPLQTFSESLNIILRSQKLVGNISTGLFRNLSAKDRLRMLKNKVGQGQAGVVKTWVWFGKCSLIARRNPSDGLPPKLEFRRTVSTTY